MKRTHTTVRGLDCARINNFLSLDERLMIANYFNEVKKRHSTFVKDKGMPEPPDNKPLKKFMRDKRAEWMSALKVRMPGSTRTYCKAIMDGGWDCPIKSFLDIMDELLLAGNYVSTQEEVQNNLAKGLQVCKDAKMKCLCSAD